MDTAIVAILDQMEVDHVPHEILIAIMAAFAALGALDRFLATVSVWGRSLKTASFLLGLLALAHGRHH